MILARVVGQVWATKKNPWLQGQKLLVLRPLTWYNPEHHCDHIIAVDPVGAEVGQDVVCCLGLPTRWELGDERYPVEASVAAIVDLVEVYKSACEKPKFTFMKGHKPTKIVERD